MCSKRPVPLLSLLSPFVLLSLLFVGVSCGGDPPKPTNSVDQTKMDLASKPCGQLFTCVLACGQKLDPACAGSCCAGAAEADCKNAQSLATCALLQCGLDIPSPVRFGLCLLTSCADKTSKCSGLPNYNAM